MPENDSVNHPSHYTNGNVECIDAIRSSMNFYLFCGYLQGNIMKYVWRYRLKEHPVEDLKKARWYIDKLIETLENSDMEVIDIHTPNQKDTEIKTI